MKNVGLYIGRFQPFHYGHLSAVKFALRHVRQLYIIVGSSQKSHESRNPFTAGERIIMIRRALEAAGVDPARYLIIPIPDAAGHAVWTASIDQVVPKYDIVFSNDSLTLQLFKEKGIETMEVPLEQRSELSATEVRKRIIGGQDWEPLVPPIVVHVIRSIIKMGRFEGLE